MKITEFHVKISTQNVCEMIEGAHGSFLYQEIQEELEAMLPEAYSKVCPTVLLEFGMLNDGREVLFEVATVGAEISNWSTRLFADGDYLGGMLASAIADDYLFQMDKEVQNSIITMCRECGKGIAKRLEAPKDIPMSVQKEAFEATHAALKAGMKLTEGFMLDPVKSLCQVYLLDDRKERFSLLHDCRNCDHTNCHMRKNYEKRITIQTKDGEWEVSAPERKSLLQLLQEYRIPLSAVCGGRGSCGKCRVQVLNGSAPVTEADRSWLDENEIKEGWRLACSLYPENGSAIRIFPEEENYDVITEGKCTCSEESVSRELWGIAVDIGTTTIAMQRVSIKNGTVSDSYTAVNSQRIYGADVISRITASNEGRKEELKYLIRRDLEKGLNFLTDQGALQIQRMVIAANTVMVHLLMGYTCETLGTAPFLPVSTNIIHTTGSVLLDWSGKDFEVTIVPGISAYLGGDILSGLYALGFHKRHKPAALIDLGTNGEMVAGNQDILYAASAAAGPAFEGGNIVCGTGSIYGAVCGMEMTDGSIRIRTIGDEAPKGICGTGVIEAVYELRKEEIIEETGRLLPPYCENGFALAHKPRIRLYQKDIREIQLAKAAVRAGFEMILSGCGLRASELDKIYIAGGFGHRLNVHKAVGIGLLPAECEERTAAAGNSSLQGAVKILMESDAQRDLENLKSCIREVNLSGDKRFQELYIENMYFCDI